MTAKEGKKARRASGEQDFRSSNAIQKHLDFIMEVTETSQRMSLVNSHYKAWTSEEEGRLRSFCQQKWFGACRVNLMCPSRPGRPEPPCGKCHGFPWGI